MSIIVNQYSTIKGRDKHIPLFITKSWMANPCSFFHFQHTWNFADLCECNDRMSYQASIGCEGLLIAHVPGCAGSSCVLKNANHVYMKKFHVREVECVHWIIKVKLSMCLRATLWSYMLGVEVKFHRFKTLAPGYEQLYAVVTFPLHVRLAGPHSQSGCTNEARQNGVVIILWNCIWDIPSLILG
jgi:hypothetical protein